jgi:UDP-N-acetylmuramoyl-L-alanyl-D-glutamate--2,6-diaminopimelate ligase
MKEFLETHLPRRVYRALLVPYHYLWALASSLWYRFPAKELVVIGVTGTKGKTSVSEMLGAILTEAGHKTAISSTIHFAIGETSRPNTYKMTLPGRGFVQKFLRDAVNAGCTHAVLEITSESTLQSRHCFLFLDALVFTNLTKEHIESHGSMEKYFEAKYRIGKALAASSKRPRAIIANKDNEYGRRFLKLPVERQIPFSRKDAESLAEFGNGIRFLYNGVPFTLPHPGSMSAENALAAIKTAEFFGVPLTTAMRALEKLSVIPGRAERIVCGQDFLAVVDYAHTPDSLRALYDAFKEKRKICVLGNTGGGRDTWKRPEMGRIAEEACAEVILTNEDPYDEAPEAIVEQMAAGMRNKPRIIMDRRTAIRTALSLAGTGDAVLISGKGTDPYIMEAKGKKTPWSDRAVVEEELTRLLSS